MTYQEIYQALKPKIKKDFGKGCDRYFPACAICEAYRTLFSIEVLALMEKEEMKGKKK